jgi:hypothetical protein
LTSGAFFDNLPTWGRYGVRIALASGARVYCLNAVIGDIDLIRDRAAGLGHAVVAVLRQGLAMVPVTVPLCEEAAGVLPETSGGHPSGRQPFHRMVSSSFEGMLAEWSRRGPIAYVEAEFFGGDGYQSAAVWRDGARTWGPMFDAEFTGPRDGWPINAALTQLGVTPSGRVYSHDPEQPVDLFDEVGLGLERDIQDWLAYGRAGRTPGHYEALAREAARRDAERELARVRPDLDGRSIMTVLGIPPGPLVGAATRHLRQLRVERGPLSRADAVAELRAWAWTQGIGAF